MDEQTEKKTEEKKPEESTGDTEEGNKSKEPQVIVNANAAAERLEKANEERARLLGREEELVARKLLGGRAEAGQSPVVKEETALEYSKRVDKGEANPLKDDGFI